MLSLTSKIKKMKNILDNATVVDVRTPEEYARDHYPGAINVPVEQIPYRVDEFRQMSSPIVTYCRSGNRSEIAVGILKQGGIKEVYNGGGLVDLLQQSK